MHKTLPELVYLIGYSLKKNYKLKNQKRIPYKVVSIGNITLGGTGKTPAIISLVKEAQKRRVLPIILTRGYKGKVREPVILKTDELKNSDKLDVKLLGDEIVLMAEKLDNVYIVKYKDRYKASKYVIEYLENKGIDNNLEIMFFLDDGFQHWGLYRDKDILLIDSLNPFGNNRLFPMGILREPLYSLERADIVLITKSNLIDEENKKLILREIKRYNENCPIFFSEHKAISLINKDGEKLNLDFLENKDVFAFCGIGNPDSFEKILGKLGFKLKGFRKYRDHYKYRLKDIEDILRESENVKADWIITTEKDLVRIKDIIYPENLLALEIEFCIENKDIFYDRVFSF